jgi:hypothetical protein
MAEDLVPCIPLELPEIPDITLIGGAKLSGFLDFSQGMPTQCTVNASLMLQLAPVLASLTPLLKILAVIKGLKAAAESAFLDSGDLLSAIADLVPLFVALTPAGMAVTIAGILRLIISFMNCFIAQLESAVSFQANISALQAEVDLNPAAVSPVLLASLSCAKANAEISMQGAMASLGPIQPLLEVVTSVAGVAGISLDLAIDVSGAADTSEVISTLKTTITSIEEAINALPV